MIAMMIAAAALSPTAGKIMASDDWLALRVLQVGLSKSAGAPLYLRVNAGDIDGDGIADEAIVKLICSAGAVKKAFIRATPPRDVASGQSSGKRTHKPVTFVKEWGPSTPQLYGLRPTYDVRTLDRKKWTAELYVERWTAITLGSSDGLCAAAASARTTFNKSKSNVKNN